MNPTTVFWLNIAGVLASGLGLFLISLMETALVSVSRVRMRQLSEEGHPTAPIVARLTAHPQELLGGQVILVNIFVLLIANLTTAVARRQWGDGAVVWCDLLVLVLLLIFTEITPKTLSVYFADGVALRTARLASFLFLLLAPFVAILNGIAIGVLSILRFFHLVHGRVRPAPTAYSEEDIKELVSAGEQSGEVEASEREMIHSAIEFADTSADEIMVPRTDLVALPVDATLEEAIEAFMDSGHSRIPVYEESVDNILGLLYVKDLLIRFQEIRQAARPLRALLRPAYFIPESKKSDDLLREMQAKQVHLAIVVDEYGGTAGIITIEDLLEEIVGEIIDEYDTEEDEVVEQPDGSCRVSGRASLEKIHDTFDIPIPEDTDAETISGLITERLGRIPEAGDQLSLAGVDFTVLEVKHNRVEYLRAVIKDDGK